ncbi:Sulfite reduction-associated complex DsrMKJOP protein DsrM (= HmeC) [hydrothermal vent metagenome]|uniref:Sulfite reduction-associated complex DsrMKJOP protein DsrM (= HmeC) n=1 Tax=hydrothermal vent metagenome TaxID=652676 RepID=A0A3B0Y8A5_9ZZZZ
MSLVSTLYVGLFYFATVFLVVGLALRIKLYAQTPAPLVIPTMPAPRTQTGVVFRLFREVAFFESLFRSNKWIWVLGYLFHFGMVLVLLRHLRYFTEPVWFWVNWVQPFGKYASFAMLAGLLGLWARRFLVARIRYISTPSDHLMLALLVGIAMTGIGMSFLVHTDIVSVKVFFLGLLHFSPQPLPTDPLLLVHLGLVATLMIIFPISKLLHAPGVFFSPTRNQTDSSREQRHIADWAKDLEAGER